MRDKFSDLIDQKIATFEYQNLHQSTSSYDPICAIYNNSWGFASDTHMSLGEDGRRYITGRLVAQTERWTQFKYSSMWGGLRFKESTGIYSLNEFLFKYKLDPQLSVVNGDVVCVLVDYDIPSLNPDIPNCCVTMESGIKKPISYITVDRNENTVKNCFNGTISEVVENLNNNTNIKGNNWMIADGKIVGIVENKTIIL